MNTAIPFTEEDIRRSNEVPPTSTMAATASSRGLCVIDWFFRCYVNPRLGALREPDDLQLALNALAMRMASCVASLAALNSVAHINGIAAVSRVVFELWLDVRAIERSIYPDSGTKFWTFVMTERLRMARQVVAYDDAHPGVVESPPTVHRDFVATQAAAIESEAQRLWRINRPKHWSGTADIRQRAAAVDLEDRYINLYPLLSTYSHGGAAGVAGLTLDDFHAFVHLSYDVAADAAVDTVRILGQQCGLRSGIRDFDAKVNFLGGVTGFILTDLQLMSLGEPQRLVLDLGPCPELEETGA